MPRKHPVKISPQKLRNIAKYSIAEHQAYLREVLCAAALALENARVVVPAGWKLVPIEPTDEMYNAVTDACQESTIWLSAGEVWTAMLTAVPSEAKP